MKSHSQPAASRFTGILLAAGLALSCHSLSEAASTEDGVGALVEAIAKDPPWADFEGLSRHSKLAIELGDSAIPALERRLNAAHNPDERLRIAITIAYIGGKKAVSILQRDAARSPSVSAKTAFALAVPSAPSTESSAILISYLEGPQIGSGWPPIVQSAYSLGIMRDRAAIPSLQAAATKKEGYGTFAASASRDAIDWITGAQLKVLFLTSSPDDNLLQAIFAAGVPELAHPAVWCQSSTPRRSWQIAQGVLTVKAGCPAGSNHAAVSIDVYRSSDGERALVAIGFSRGPKNGEGFNYILTKLASGWQVIGLQPTWVS